MFCKFGTQELVEKAVNSFRNLALCKCEEEVLVTDLAVPEVGRAHHACDIHESPSLDVPHVHPVATLLHPFCRSNLGDSAVLDLDLEEVAAVHVLVERVLRKDSVRFHLHREALVSCFHPHKVKDTDCVSPVDEDVVDHVLDRSQHL